MIADLGTRKGTKIADISDDSYWINGLRWMSRDKSSFPVQSVTEIKLNKSDIEAIQGESFITNCMSDMFTSFHMNPSRSLNKTLYT